MITVRIDRRRIDYIMSLVQELRDRGYRQGKDFDFAYHPEVNDMFARSEMRYTEFMFYDEQLALIFKLSISNGN